MYHMSSWFLFHRHLSNNHSALSCGSTWSLPCSRLRRRTCCRFQCHRLAWPGCCPSWKVRACQHMRIPIRQGHRSRRSGSIVTVCFFFLKKRLPHYRDILWAFGDISWSHLDVPNVWARLELGSSPHGPGGGVVGNIGKGNEEVGVAQLGVARPAIDRSALWEKVNIFLLL